MDDARMKIIGAFLVGLALLSLTLFLRISQQPSKLSGELVATPTETKPREVIAVSDKNQDGIPDWQEALNKTEPIILEKTDTVYRPETLTDEFSTAFLQDMVLARNYGEFGNTPEELANRATEQMAQFAVDELYQEKDLNISNDNSDAAIRKYTNQVAQIILDNTVPADSLSELEILKQAYTKEDEKRLDDLDPIISMYDDILSRTLLLPVPSSYKKEHLDIINVYKAVYNDIDAMKLAFSDPLKAVIRLKRYEEDVTAMYVVLLNLQKKVVLSGITFSLSEPAYELIVNP